MKILKNSLLIVVFAAPIICLRGSLRAPDSLSLFCKQDRLLEVPIVRLELENIAERDIPLSAAQYSGVIRRMILEQGNQNSNSERSIFIDKNINKETLQALALCLEKIDEFANDYTHIKEWFVSYIDQLPVEVYCELKTLIYLLNVESLVTYYDNLKKKSYNFRCSWSGCDYATDYQSNLKRHIDRQHRLSAPENFFQCPHPNCDYLGRYKWNLNYHMKIHSGEKQYKCHFPKCDYAAYRNDYLKSHIINKHTERTNRNK